jgi:hypothetical protein
VLRVLLWVTFDRRDLRYMAWSQLARWWGKSGRSTWWNI